MAGKEIPEQHYGRDYAKNEFRYVFSHECETQFRIKVGTLEGSLPRLGYEDLLKDPILKFSGRNLSKFPDLKVEVVIVDYPDLLKREKSLGNGSSGEDEDDDDDDDEVWGNGCRFPRVGGIPLHTPVFTSYKYFTRRWEWNEWLKLPLRYSDLPRTAVLAITIYDCCGSGGIGQVGPNQVAIGGTTVSLFCKDGTARQGPVDLRVWPSVTADPRRLKDVDGASSSSSSSQPPPPSTGAAPEATVADGDSKANETLRRLAKLTKKYRAGKMQQVDWMDRLTFAEIERINQREKSKLDMMFLDVQFLRFQSRGLDYSIVYFEPGAEQLLEPPTDGGDLVKIADHEIGQENLVEAKHYWLARSTRTGQSETELKPNASIRNRLNDVLLYPPTQTLSSEELDLVWRFRFYLSANRKALAKFVKCINWRVPQQAEQALDLIERWAPMDAEDALELLGPSFTNPGLRQYAVGRMRRSPDEDLQLYLLQLVQALKYEPLQPHDPHVLWKREMGSIGRPPLVMSVEQTIEEELQKLSQPSSGGGGKQRCGSAGRKEGEDLRGSGGLAQFLIERACKNSVIANYFYWYLIVECEDNVEVKNNSVVATNVGGNGSTLQQASTKQMYAIVLKRFLETLSGGPAEWQARAQFLSRQYAFVDELVQLIRAVARESGGRQKKIEKLQQFLASGTASSKQQQPPPPSGSKQPYSFVRLDPPLKLPLDPDVEIRGVIPSRATLFKSSLAPARLSFVRADTGEEYVSIFKHGDDLRQDQLILQIITLFDRILQQENLDLKLTPYRVLATSSRHGFVQFVNSTPVAEVLASEGNIQNFFRKHNPCDSSPHGIKTEVMNTYVKSCAGYCVITYLLGVGDRHLDNLLLTRDGKLFHIDFGYILGRDPKPMPPPMKLSREMIDAFGGTSEEYYQEFRRECYTAFLSLRRHANLILNLFSLMVDATVPDIALEPDKTVKKVQDKFRLDLNDEEAVNHIQTLIDHSASAVMPAIVERIHKFAQLLRN